MTAKTKCGCDDDQIMGVEYELTDPNHYDGVSEWRCQGCGNRVGRWSGKLLKEGESERRFAAPSKEDAHGIND